MREPKTAEELGAYLEALDLELRSQPGRDVVGRAKKARRYLEALQLSRYMTRNLRMRSEGVLGDALFMLDQRDEAGKVYHQAMDRPAAPAERASLAIRTTRYFAESLKWGPALSEAQFAVTHFTKHRPRHETDLRSLTGALVARGTVAFWAFVMNEGSLEIDLLKTTEQDFRAALKRSSPRTEHCSIAAATNLCNLAIRCWWAERRIDGVDPLDVAQEMKRVCKLLTKRGVPFRSRLHAKARWIHGLAVVQVYGILNREAERRLERVFDDLLRFGAINDATELAMDLVYCYLREYRWSEALIVISAVLQHPKITVVSVAWRQALLTLREAIEHRRQSQIINTYETIRGFRVAWADVPAVRVPRHRYSDRSDTFGF